MNVLITTLVSYIYLVGLKGKFSWFIITITLVKLSLYFLSFFASSETIFVSSVSICCIYRNYICILLSFFVSIEIIYASFVSFYCIERYSIYSHNFFVSLKIISVSFCCNCRKCTIASAFFLYF